MPRFSVLYGLILSVIACVPVPVPHTVLQHSNIRGRVVDDATGLPIKGIRIYLDSDSYRYTLATPRVRAETGVDGVFSIEPKPEWRYLWILAFLPFERSGCSDRLELEGPSPASAREKSYRTLQVQILSCPPSPLLLQDDGGRRNKALQDDLGVLRMKLFPVLH